MHASSAPLRLLHIFPTFAVGGSQRRFAQVAEALAGQYHHTVASLDGVCDMERYLPPGVEVVRPAISKSSGPAHWLACHSQLRALKPDILVCHNWGSMDWCIANLMPPSRRHIHIEDGFGPEEQSSQLPRRVLTRRLVLSRRSSKLVVPSLSLEQLARNIWQLPGRNIEYIPNAVDCARFCPPTNKNAGEKLVIGTVATLRREKNLERLIRLFAALAENGERAVELVIVGDGPERGKLEQAAEKSGHSGRIRFAGPSASPERELAKFDVFALTSDTEQMPLSVLEAMACGLPVISFAVGDVPEMVSPSNRPFACYGLADEAGFMTGLRALASDAGLRERLGRANRGLAMANYDQAKMFRRYASLFG